MRDQAPDVVRSSRTAMATTALMWLLFPTGWPTFLWAIALAVALHDTYDTPRNLMMLTIIGVVAALSWWVWWRYAGVSARRRQDGIRVRGFRRTVTVRWEQVREVTSTESEGVGESFNFSWTVITYRTDAGERRSVRVSRSFRSGAANRRVIMSWFPPGHGQYAPLPAAKTEA